MRYHCIKFYLIGLLSIFIYSAERVDTKYYYNYRSIIGIGLEFVYGEAKLM